MLTDTHCHLTSGKFGNDREEVMGAAREAGVTRIICPAENLEDAKRIVELAKKEEGIWGLAGYYPGQAKLDQSGKWKIESRKLIEGLKEFIKENKKLIVGIGEIGLDQYWLGRQAEVEREMFREQLELGVEMGLPVVVHNRGAEEEIRQVMESFGRAQDKGLRGQFHCWSGSDEFLDWVLERDFYVGFCGNVTYPKNEKLREQARRVPRERLLLETDSPYLPPQGKRGERNTPTNVRITAEFLANLRGVSLQELAELTSSNARELFGI